MHIWGTVFSWGKAWQFSGTSLELLLKGEIFIIDNEQMKLSDADKLYNYGKSSWQISIKLIRIWLCVATLSPTLNDHVVFSFPGKWGQKAIKCLTEVLSEKFYGALDWKPKKNKKIVLLCTSSVGAVATIS